MKRWASVLFWSVLSAAFIGPGTVTTCATAGARHGLALLWALAFSTVACIVLQEAAARVATISGLDLGQALRAYSRGRAGGALTVALVLGAVVIGCAAYEAGNILGAVAGASLGVRVPARWTTAVVGAVAAGTLWLAATGTVARLLGAAVGVMGAAFLVTAALLAPAPAAMARGVAWPSLPPGSGLLVLGLVGTTVVPYNLFLGSGLARGQDLRTVRFGIAVAVGLGGVISMGIVVVGTAASEPFGFAALAEALESGLGAGATGLLALGLFAAGLSSAMTAPLAAAVTTRGLFQGDEPARWHDRSWRFRGVWLAVVAVGVAFGASDVRPVPAILLAQALNGILLPVISVFLMVLVNDRRLLGDHGINGPFANTVMAATAGVTLILGSSAVVRAVAGVAGRDAPPPAVSLWISSAAALGAGAWTWRRVRAARARATETAEREGARSP